MMKDYKTRKAKNVLQDFHEHQQMNPKEGYEKKSMNEINKFN